MKNHVMRPLWVAIGVVSIFFMIRHFLVPSDFGVHGRNFTYGFHRLGSMEEWKSFPIGYRGKDTCQECHPENFESTQSSRHQRIQCENCHGPGFDHPENPELLDIDRSRQLCLRCHSYLPYPDNMRSTMKSIDAEEHNPNEECVLCHNPHNPNLEDM